MVLWHRSPTTVQAVEQRLFAALTGPLQQRIDAAFAEQDAAVQERRLREVLEDLAAVQRQDRLAPSVVACKLRLADLADARGDHEQAVGWLRACVAFDDHDLPAMSRLGELLCRKSATASEGFALLQGLDARFPANPDILPALARSLIGAGRTDVAFAALAAAEAEPQSNLWYVFWDTGSEFDVHHACLVPSQQDGSLRLRFDLLDPCRRLRFVLPRFSSMSLLEPRLTIVAGELAHGIDLLGPAAWGHQVEKRPDRIEALGFRDAHLDVDLPDLTPGGWEVTLSAIVRTRPSSLLSRATVTPAMREFATVLAERGDEIGARRLRVMRNVAHTAQRMQCFFRRAGESFGPDRVRDAVIDSPGDDTLSVAFTVGEPAAALRIDLPDAAPGLEYRWRSLVVVVDGKEVALDPSTMPLLGMRHCERGPGAFLATGDDPCFWFDAPPGQTVDAVRLTGVL